MDWLSAAKSFILTAEYGSFTQAAEELNISSSAVSKRIDWLEKQMGQSLLIRTTRHVQLSEAGHLLLPKAQALIAQFDHILEHSQEVNKTPSGTLKIAATLAVGNSLLMPSIQAFLAQYPQIKIQLNVLAPGTLPDLHHDLVITRHYNEFDSVAHKGTCLLEYQMKLFASPCYLQRHSAIKSVDDLAGHKMLLSSYYQKKGHIMLSDNSIFTFKDYNFVSDHLDAMLEAAIQGMGLMLISAGYIHKQLQEGTLVPVLPHVKSANKQLWAYYPNSAFIPIKTRLFIDHLKQQLATQHTL
ncbi:MULTISPECIES: LysR family transcriptional regulator [Pseudoalteromonas]|uniref:LysR family transcriptional regulator n=1 Tax=Pseudoalteromonas amylolytica TaxID=1859457 RepID=A0A1S1MMR6_9GAMM|nr:MULTISPECIES: LysR family transcriptional regulator [Pseudoalteromonas]OHU86837.1 LysR family transcriptional regulator [Pseudoalteromonas amylolytica]OHU89504.1 LysR family transcriptional regulator [Pseudoalteromonas sp. JW3]